jgi:D-glycerate 3-kinase
VNAELAGRYGRLFARLDRLIALQAPGLEAVRRWRRQQEAPRRAAGLGMDDAALERFVDHYERLTRHALSVLPSRADLVVGFGDDHRVAWIRDGFSTDSGGAGQAGPRAPGPPDVPDDGRGPGRSGSRAGHGPR